MKQLVAVSAQELAVLACAKTVTTGSTAKPGKMVSKPILNTLELLQQ